jgi:hypothetical protein
MVLSLIWARFTPAGAPGESGSPAKAADVDKAKARKQESSRMRHTPKKGPTAIV